jgi:hypothetical protein
MQVKMSEYFQGTGVSAVSIRTGNPVTLLEPGEEYEIDGANGKYLLDNRKAVELKTIKRETKISEPVIAPYEDKVELTDELVEDNTIMSTESKSKRSKK